MAALNSITLSAYYHTTATKPFIQLNFEKKRAAYALIALENLRFGKINALLLQDSNTQMTAKLKKNGTQYALSFLMTTLPITENQVERILSLLLDAINGAVAIGQHYDLQLPNIALRITLDA